MDNRMTEGIIMLIIGMFVGVFAVVAACSGDETLEEQIKKERLRSLKLDNDRKEAEPCPSKSKA